ncbi:hypothetical protein NAS2_0683 [Conexivisphaera calida]|uniref:Sm domain-containing protein n=1 Tax=Conexivisphaera calida TaxID=1874277 RepID=A0A4P2VE08_9ARCH|nr:hypothetical protein NAS2_0683 [Conexivisphaera calida]
MDEDHGAIPIRGAVPGGRGSGTGRHRTPFNVLRGALNREVRVVLRGGVELRGTLRAYDQFINLHLEDVFRRAEGGEARKYQELFVRGSNVVWVEPARGTEE